jgi:hypothetical protein
MPGTNPPAYQAFIKELLQHWQKPNNSLANKPNNSLTSKPNNSLANKPNKALANKTNNNSHSSRNYKY